MVELIVLACLVADPLSCKKIHLPFMDATTARRCLAWSQPSLAMWNGDNPEWSIKSWRCGSGTAQASAY